MSTAWLRCRDPYPERGRTCALYCIAAVGWWSARSGNVRIWIDSGLNRSRRHDIWPPRCHATGNEVDDVWLAITACIVILLAQPPGVWIYSNAGLTAGGILVASFVGVQLLARKIVASTPEECWYARTRNPPSTEEIRHAG